MSDGTIIIFANPIAGRGQGRAISRRIESALRESGFVTQLFFDRASDVVSNSLDQPLTAVITIGGDGTLRAAADLFISTNRTVPPFIPISMGTANLMSKHLGIAWHPRHIPRGVVDTIRRGKIIRLDAGLANGRLFLLMAGVGIDAQIVHLLDRVRRGPIDFTSYLLPAALTFAGYDFPPITVQVDEKLLLQNSSAIVLIGNVKEYGIGFPILTEAAPDDGLLDICIMPCRNRLELVEILVHIAAGEHTLREAVIYVRGKSIQVESDHPVAVQIDGDSAGFTPLQIKVLPACVPFFLPV